MRQKYAPFWEDENVKPIEYRTRYNKFRYYREAQFLAVSKPDFLDTKSGQMRMGKTVMVFLPDLAEEPEVLDALISILQHVKPAAPAQQG